MKMYLTPDQTAKLIELGFEQPKNALPIRVENKALVYQFRYTIGELIEMLPIIIDTGFGHSLSIYHNTVSWDISYDGNGLYHPLYSVEKDELIDALYDMIVKLKEEGVI